MNAKDRVQQLLDDVGFDYQLTVDRYEDEFVIVNGSYDKVANVFKDWVANAHNHDIFEFLMHVLADEYGYGDEYIQCSNCYCAIHVGHEDFWRAEDGNYCDKCTQEMWVDYLESLINNPQTANTMLTEKQLNEQGFFKLEYEYCNSYYGDNDNPMKVFADLQEKYEEVIFSLVGDRQNPFSVSWVVYVRKGE